jgi:hypothetical protein
MITTVDNGGQVNMEDTEDTEDTEVHWAIMTE